MEHIKKDDSQRKWIHFFYVRLSFFPAERLESEQILQENSFLCVFVCLLWKAVFKCCTRENVGRLYVVAFKRRHILKETDSEIFYLKEYIDKSDPIECESSHVFISEYIGIATMKRAEKEYMEKERERIHIHKRIIHSFYLGIQYNKIYINGALR